MIFNSGESDHRDKNIREDEFQLMLSLITSRWHWFLYSGMPPQNVAGVLHSDVSKIVKHSSLKASYSLNIFKTMLFLSGVYFVTGEREKQVALSYSAIEVYRRLVASMAGKTFPISNHFADLGKANNAVEVMLSGKEWVNGERFRQHRWNPSRIMHACSRVSLSSYPDFMDRGLSFFDSKYFEISR